MQLHEGADNLVDSGLEHWYSMKEICEYLGVSRDPVLAWIEKYARRKNRTPLEIQGQRSGRLDEIRRCAGKVRERPMNEERLNNFEKMLSGVLSQYSPTR